jgi:hypothetical protein
MIIAFAQLTEDEVLLGAFASRSEIDTLIAELHLFTIWQDTRITFCFAVTAYDIETESESTLHHPDDADGDGWSEWKPWSAAENIASIREEATA